MVTIRLTRRGAKNQPFYHVVVTDSRKRQGGASLEHVGYFNPVARGKDTRLKLDLERIDYWRELGAQESDRVRTLVASYHRQRGRASGRGCLTVSRTRPHRRAPWRARLGQGSVLHRPAGVAAAASPLAAAQARDRWDDADRCSRCCRRNGTAMRCAPRLPASPIAMRPRRCANSEILIERAALPPASEREYYLEDLLGFTVRNLEGVVLGDAAAFPERRPAPLMVVRGEREQLAAGATAAPAAGRSAAARDRGRLAGRFLRARCASRSSRCFRR